jgi:hypothetical protein
VDFSEPHYKNEHLVYYTDHRPMTTIDVTRETTSGTVGVTVLLNGKRIAHGVADDSNHNVGIMGTPNNLMVQ